MKRILFTLFGLIPTVLFGQSIDAALKTLVTSGSANVYTITEALPATYTNKERFIIQFHIANTGPSTLNRAGLGAKAIKKNVDEDLASGDIKTGARMILSYNGTAYQLVGSVGGGGHIIENAGTPLTSRPNLNFSNGLTASDNTPDTDVKFGGPLTDNTTVGVGGNLMSFDITDGTFRVRDLGTAGYITMDASGGTNAGVEIFAGTGANYANLKLGITATQSARLVHSGSVIFEDQRGTPRGIEYSANISATLNPLSLIFKSYADATYAPISGGAYWSLASGGTITGVNTFTSNTANRINFTGTWTATAINQFAAQFGGAFTARTNTSDNLLGYSFNPSLTGGATNTQNLLAVSVTPTLVGGADGTDRGAALYVEPTFTNLMFRYGIASVSATTANYTGLRIMNSSGTGSAVLDMVALSGASLGSSSQFYIERLTGAGGAATIANIGGGAINYTVGSSGLRMDANGRFYALNGANGGLAIWNGSAFLVGISTNGTGMDFTVSAGYRYNFTGQNEFLITQNAQAAGHANALRINAGSHSSIAAATELHSFAFNYTFPTQQWTGGGSWTGIPQRFFYVGSTTMSFTSATTVPDVYTAYIEPPIQGTNATLTRIHALGLGGNLRIPADASATNGRIYLGAGNDNFSTTAAITVASTNGLAAFQNWSAYSNNGSTEFRIAGNASPGLEFVNFSGGGTTATIAKAFVRFREGITSSSAGLNYTSVSIIPTYNVTGSWNGTLIGLDISSINTSLTGATHLAIRSASGGVMIGSSTDYTVVGLSASPNVGHFYVGGGSNQSINIGTSTSRWSWISGVSGVDTEMRAASTHARYGFTSLGQVYMTQSALAANWRSALILTPGAHTAIPNTQENIDFDFGGGTVTQTWAGGGTVSRQTATIFRGRTYAASSAQTFTSLYNVLIENPVLGANVSAGTRYALAITGGLLQSSASPSDMHFNGNWTTTANNQQRLMFEGTYTQRATQFDTFVYYNIFPTLNPGANDQNFILQAMAGTFALGAFTGTYLVGLDYNMQVSGAAAAQHMALRVRSGNVLIGDQTVMTAGDILLELNHASRALVVTRFAGDVANPVNGMIHYNTTSNALRARINGAWVSLGAGGGGGISNTAAANEMMKSDGTNAVPSGVFSTSAGDLNFGTGLTGATRTFYAEGSASDVGFQFVIKGNYGILVKNTSASQVTSFSTQNSDISNYRYSANATGQQLNLAKFRGTVGAGTIVLNGDEVGAINFLPAIDGSSLALTATIKAVVNGTVVASPLSIPTDLVFMTGANSIGNPTSERFRISSDGIFMFTGSQVALDNSSGLNFNIASSATELTIGSFAESFGSSGQAPSVILEASPNSGFGSTGIGGHMILRSGAGSGVATDAGSIYFSPAGGTGTARDGNVGFFSESVNWQGMEKGLFILSAVTAPTGNPSAGAYFWVDPSTQLPKWKVPGGTVYTLTDTGGGGGLTFQQALGINALRIF